MAPVGDSNRKEIGMMRVKSVLFGIGLAALLGSGMGSFQHSAEGATGIHAASEVEEAPVYEKCACCQKPHENYALCWKCLLWHCYVCTTRGWEGRDWCKVCARGYCGH